MFISVCRAWDWTISILEHKFENSYYGDYLLDFLASAKLNCVLSLFSNWYFRQTIGLLLYAVREGILCDKLKQVAIFGVDHKNFMFFNDTIRVWSWKNLHYGSVVCVRSLLEDNFSPVNNVLNACVNVSFTNSRFDSSCVLVVVTCASTDGLSVHLLLTKWVREVNWAHSIVCFD